MNCKKLAVISNENKQHSGTCIFSLQEKNTKDNAGELESQKQLEVGSSTFRCILGTIKKNPIKIVTGIKYSRETTEYNIDNLFGSFFILFVFIVLVKTRFCSRDHVIIVI
jgi:hypothetical protein